MTSRRHVSWTSRLLPLAAALLVLPVLGAPAQADPSDPVDPAGPPAAATPQELAEQALEKVEDLVEDAADLTGPSEHGTLHPEGKQLTLALAELSTSRSELPAGKRAAAARLLARPTDQSSTCFQRDLTCYGSRVDKRACNTIACVHWITEGPDRIPTENDGAGGVYPGTSGGLPDYVELVLSTLNTVGRTYRDAGYRAPVPDGGKDAEVTDTAEFDVYLGNVGDDGAYGYCSPDDVKEHKPAASYCVLDNDFAEFGISPRNALRVTVAHEYFHAVQFAYDVNEDAWLMEATATWAEDELYDSINDNRYYLEHGPLARPQQSLDLYSDLSQYGTWIFFRFLGERFTSRTGRLPSIVREIWTRTPSQYSVQAIRNALHARGSSMTTQFTHFQIWNRRPSSYYDEGSAYRPSPTRGTFKLTPARPKKTLKVRLDHLAASTYRFTRPATGRASWRVRVAVNLNSRAAAPAAFVTLKVKGQAPRIVTVRLSSTGSGSVTLPFGTKVQYVDVTPINASTRYSGCGDPDRTVEDTCQGFPLDDDKVQAVSVLAFRG